METSILLALLIIVVAVIVLGIVAVHALLDSNRGYRDLVLAIQATHQDDREYLLRAVVGKHAGDVAYLSRVDDAVDIEAARLQMRERSLYDHAVSAERDPETGEPMNLVGMGG